MSQPLKAYALALVGNSDVADDLVQETLLKICEGTALPDSDEKARRYAFRMLRNLHIDNLRKTRVRAEYSAEQERLFSGSPAPAMDPTEQLIVRDAFSRLTANHREILFLVDVMGFKYAEVAETLDIATGTVMSRISRARAEMIEKLEASPVRSLRQGVKRRK